jgi:hypothetical protein
LTLPYVVTGLIGNTLSSRKALALIRELQDASTGEGRFRHDKVRFQEG